MCLSAPTQAPTEFDFDQDVLGNELAKMQEQGLKPVQIELKRLGLLKREKVSSENALAVMYARRAVVSLLKALPPKEAADWLLKVTYMFLWGITQVSDGYCLCVVAQRCTDKQGKIMKGFLGKLLRLIEYSHVHHGVMYLSGVSGCG